jgi:hypothetical protein
LEQTVGGSEIAESPTLERLRRSVEDGIVMADELGLSLVAIWLEHARQELGPVADRDHPDATG